MGGKSPGSNGQMMTQDEAVTAANQNVMHAFFGQPLPANWPAAADPPAVETTPAAAPEAAPAVIEPEQPATPAAPAPTTNSSPISPGHAVTTPDTKPPTGNLMAQSIAPAMWQDQLKKSQSPDNSSMTINKQV
jgi:hypothetical protein